MRTAAPPPAPQYKRDKRFSSSNRPPIKHLMDWSTAKLMVHHAPLQATLITCLSAPPA